jgi:hypothetical protein
MFQNTMSTSDDTKWSTMILFPHTATSLILAGGLLREEHDVACYFCERVDAPERVENVNDTIEVDPNVL